MELQEKIQRAINSDFIGDIQFTKEEIENMMRDCKNFYNSAQKTWSKTYSDNQIEELIVLIVNLTKTWDDEKENRFWVKLFGEIFDNPAIQPLTFYNYFESAFKRRYITLFKSKENKRMFREVFLLHAFAPEKSRNSFVSLLWNWFVDPELFDRDYQSNIELCSTVSNFLYKKFSGETNMDEDSSFEGKTYAIRSSFKYLFTQSKEIGTELLKTLFSHFEEIWFDQKYDMNSFYAECCYKIINQIIGVSKEAKRRNRRERSEVINNYNRIYAAYELEDGNPSIYIPDIRAIDELAEEYLCEVFESDNLVYSTKGYVVGAEMKRRIKRITIPFSEIKVNIKSFNFRVKLHLIQQSCYETIYDSNKSLFRDYILFSSRRENRNTTCKPGPYYIAIPSVSLDEYTNCSDYRTINKFTSAIIAKEDEYIRGERHQVFFNEQPKESHIKFQGKRVDSISFVCNEMVYPLYKTVNSLRFYDSDTKIDNLVIKLDERETFYPLNKYVQIVDNTLILCLDKLKANENGHHEITIIDVSNHKQIQTFLYYLNRRVSIEFPNDSYIFGNDSFRITIRCNSSGVNELVDSCKPRSGIEKWECALDGGTIVFDLPYIKWRINSSEYWHYGPYREQHIWKNDNALLPNNCIIEVQNNSTLDISLLVNDKPISSSSSGKFLLGDALVDNRNNTSNEVSLTIGNHHKKVTLFTVHNEPYLSKIDIDLDTKTINLEPYFLGDKQTQFLIVLESDNEDYYELKTGLSSQIEDDVKDGDYYYEVYVINLFGDREEYPILKGDITIGNPDKIYFNHCIVRLTTFKGPNGKIKLENMVIKNIEFLRDGYEPVYSGVLVCNKKEYTIEFDKKSNKALRLYFTKGEDLLLSYYDLSKKVFTTEISEADNPNIVSCSSCYYEREEF